MDKIYVIHENDEWLEPLRAAFAEQELPFEEWFVSEGSLSLDDEPPPGVFYNRMSASAHTRGHRFSPEETGVLLSWLERHGRRVVNGTRALQLEVSKAAQYTALNRLGIRTPRTVAAVGAAAVAEAAQTFGDRPVLVKPNRGGTGRGVQLFESGDALQTYAQTTPLEGSLDGITLVQEYIESPERFITRAEFIGGRFFYAVRVDTGGSFELCPADPCAVRDPNGEAAGEAPRFTIMDGIDRGLIERYERFLAANDIGIGAIEFVTTADGDAFTYDVNTNTNYNSEAEARGGRYGMRAVARFLGQELAGDSPR